MRPLFTLPILLALSVTVWAAEVTVCSTSHAGGGRNLAQAVAEGGFVTFSCPGGTVINVTATIAITRHVTIDGGGRVTLRISFPTRDPMFEVADDLMPTLQNVRLVGREIAFLGNPRNFADIVRGPGAAVVLRNARMTGSTIPLRVARAVILNSELRDNGVGSAVGSLYMDRSQMIGNFSGFSVTGHTEIRDSTFADQVGSALRVAGPGCKLIIRRSRFEGNGARVPFGAIENQCDADITGTRFVRNRGLRGGALTIVPRGGTINMALRDVEFEGNHSRDFGGAIGIGGLGSVTLDVRNAEFLRNSSATGGAIASERLDATHVVRLARTVLVENTATANGGALALRHTFMEAVQVLFKGNTADAGGALYLAGFNDTLATLANVVMVGNKARLGSAIAFTGSTDLVHSTLLNNDGPAIVGEVVGEDMATVIVVALRASQPVPRTLTATNTIFAFNTAPSCGIQASGRANLQFPDASCGTSAKVADPLLDDMLVPMPNSPARGAAAFDVCTAKPISRRDFYGMPRPRAKDCSIGAVEGELEQRARLISRREQVARGQSYPWTRKSPSAEIEPDGVRLRID